jgi:Mg-chelatase subunit ChlD
MEEVRDTPARELTRFALLAQAVAGRRVAVVGGGGERAYTDGETIFVPDPATGHGSAVPPLSATLSMQAALLATGSLEPTIMAKITGRRALRLRYLSLEAARAGAVLAHVLPRRATTLVAQLYDGPIPSCAQESLAWAASPRNIPEAPAWLGTIKPIKVLRAHPAGAGAAPTDADRASQSINELLRELDDEEESDRSRILELFSAPIRNPLASMIQRFFGMGRAPGAAGGGGAELPVGGATASPVGANARAAHAAAGIGLDVRRVPLGRSYPEWDFRRRAYRPDWCSVAEFDPPRPGPNDDEPAAPMPAHDRRLGVQLARLGLTHERHRRQPDGDDLDLHALIELVVDRAAGVSGDPRVYETKRRTAHDLGVLVLLDATGSTGESSEGRKVFDEQRLLAARLTSALDELGDRVAAYGFYSRGRRAVRFLRVKDFEDRYDHAAERRLAALTPGGYTRLGAAIRHATHLLTHKAGTSQTLLVVIGDGLPYEDGYEHRYAQEDSRRALREAVAHGVGCACVSVRASTEHEILERVWGEVPHRRLDDAGSLAGHVRPLFGDALRAASATRRSVGRRPADTLA